MNNTSIKYLIDTNSLITPFKTYYPFDFAQKFWDLVLCQEKVQVKRELFY